MAVAFKSSCVSYLCLLFGFHSQFQKISKKVVAAAVGGTQGPMRFGKAGGNCVFVRYFARVFLEVFDGKLVKIFSNFVLIRALHPLSEAPGKTDYNSGAGR